MNFLRQILDVITAPVRLLLAAPRKLLEGSQRLSGLSLPARVAILTALLLVLMVIIALLRFRTTAGHAPWPAYLNGTFLIAIPVLVLVIPFALYKALQLWLEGDISPYPDIDRAWKAGLEELGRQGIDLKHVPLFLVLGTPGMRQEKSLFEAARRELAVREAPAGSAAIHWYAGQDGIFLVASGVGCLSRLAVLGNEVLSAERVRPAVRQQAEGDSLRGTLVSGPADVRGTSIAPAAKPPPSSPSAALKPSIRGTMMIGSESMIVDSEGDVAAPVDERRVITLEKGEIGEQERRLAYLSRLLRRYRQPLCPINGILTLLPFGQIQRSPPDAAAIERACRSDLGALHRGLMLRCSVTALVTGIEEESGFRELVRRLGRDPALNQRFGKGFAVSNLPLGERIEALAINACGPFEDFIYNLFRKPDALSRPGNTKLYALLCKIRHKVQDRLANILTGGFACDAEGEVVDDGFRFAGCYFAGAGESEDRQAFVAGVFDKLQNTDSRKGEVLEEEAQWTAQALKQDDGYHLASQLVLALDLLLLLALAGEIFYTFWWKGA